MIVYLFMFIGIFLAYTSTRKTKYPNRYFLIVAAVIIVLILGSRDRWNSFYDEGMYCTYYENAVGLTFEEYWNSLHNAGDYGYYFMTWALAQVIPNGQFLLYFEAAVLISAMFLFIYRECSDPIVPIFVLFGSGNLFFLLSALRQGFTAAFVLFCYLASRRALRTNSKRARLWLNVLSVVMFLLAYSMHKTVVGFLPILLIQRIRDLDWRRFLTVVSVVVLVVFRSQLLEYGNVLTKSEFIAATASSLLGFAIQMIMFFVPYLMNSFLVDPYKRRLADDSVKEQRSLLWAGGALCLVFYILRLFALVFERIAFYYIIFICALYSLTIEEISSRKSRRSITFLVCLMCVILLIYRNFNGLRSGTFTFFWQ